MPLHKYNSPGIAYYKALTKYLELVKEIPEVVEVRLSQNDTLYTVVSAPRKVDFAIIDHVIEAKMAVMDAVDP